MVWLEAAFFVAVVMGLVFAHLQARAQHALIRARSLRARGPCPPVSILKPLRGVDPGLDENLRSVFRLIYPRFDVILGAQDPDDPALGVARRVAAEFPQVRATVVSGGPAVGRNPKVNNLANLARRARYPLYLISDSNIRVPADYLADLVSHRTQAGGGLVSSLIRGVGGAGLGGTLESLQLNGPAMGGLSALTRVLKVPCALGKSMLVHRDDLERIGGFEFLGQFLAEDQICAEELTRRGQPVIVSGHIIDNILGYRTFRDFTGRHLRWARLRRHVNWWGYLVEVLVNPVFVALVGLLALRTVAAALLAVLAVGFMSSIDASTERRLGIRRPAWTYPLLELALSAVRGVLWFVPLFSSTVVWRGNALTLGPRSRIERTAPRGNTPGAVRWSRPRPLLLGLAVGSGGPGQPGELPRQPGAARPTP